MGGRLSGWKAQSSGSEREATETVFALSGSPAHKVAPRSASNSSDRPVGLLRTRNASLFMNRGCFLVVVLVLVIDWMACLRGLKRAPGRVGSWFLCAAKNSCRLPMNTVAQVANLPYRRLLIGGMLELPTAIELATRGHGCPRSFSAEGLNCFGPVIISILRSRRGSLTHLINEHKFTAVKKHAAGVGQAVSLRVGPQEGRFFGPRLPGQGKSAGPLNLLIQIVVLPPQANGEMFALPEDVGIVPGRQCLQRRESHIAFGCEQVGIRAIERFHERVGHAPDDEAVDAAPGTGWTVSVKTRVVVNGGMIVL